MKKTDKRIAYTAKVDASCNSNHNYECSISYTFYYKDEIIYEKSKQIGNMTSMEAELVGLIELLHKSVELRLPRLIVYLDCKSIVDGLNGRSKVNKDLRDLHDRAAELIKLHSDIHIQWIPRKDNKRANDLSIQCRKTGKEREIEDINKLNIANVNKHKNYIRSYKHYLMKCKTCGELKSFDSFPKKTSSEKRSCFHCISILSL